MNIYEGCDQNNILDQYKWCDPPLGTHPPKIPNTAVEITDEYLGNSTEGRDYAIAMMDNEFNNARMSQERNDVTCWKTGKLLTRRDTLEPSKLKVSSFCVDGKLI